MKKVFNFLLPVFYICNFFLLFSFRQIPQGKLWKGYSVLYVSSEIDDSIISKSLYANGITDFTTASNQYLPYIASANSTEIVTLKFNNEARKYLNDRNNYFFDKSGKYRIYYIPDNSKKLLNKSLKDLKQTGIETGIDAEAVYPLYLPICILILLSLLCFFSKNKFLFSFSAVPQFFFIVCFPYPAAALTVLFVSMIFFAASNVFNREGKYGLIKKNIFIIILAIISFFSILSVSWKCTLLYIPCCISSVCAFIISRFIENLKTNRASFNPVLIRTAYHVPVFSFKERLIFPIILAGICIITLFSVFSVDFLSVSNSEILLPGAVSKMKDENLPVLEDYYRWHFDLETYPYKSLNRQNISGTDSIYYPVYIDTDGKIEQQYVSISFDEGYISSVNNGIEALQFNAIEKILKTQGDNFCPGFSTSVSQSPGFFTIMLMLTEILFFGLIYIQYVFIRKKRGRK